MPRLHPVKTTSFPTPVYPGIGLDANEGLQMNTVAVAFIILSFAVLVLRLISRLATRVPAGMDDWLIGGAAVGSYETKLQCAKR